MADLGNIGDQQSPSEILRGGVIRGTVRDATGALAERMVRLLSRPTEPDTPLVERDRTLSSPTTGVFSFPVVDSSFVNEAPRFGEFMVLAFDDAAGTQFNALVYDRVLP